MASRVPLKEILDYFAEADWPLQEVDEASGRIYTSFRGENVVVDLEAALNLDWRLLQLTLTLPEVVPGQRLAEVLAAINRVNSKLPLGHFEIDPENRQPAYYVAVPLTGQPDLRSLFESLLAWAVDIVDQEHPKLMQTIYAEEDGDSSLAGLETPSRRFDA